jgi:selenophosphate synthetase-related protein
MELVKAAKDIGFGGLWQAKEMTLQNSANKV